MSERCKDRGSTGSLVFGDKLKTLKEKCQAAFWNFHEFCTFPISSKIALLNKYSYSGRKKKLYYFVLKTL